MLITFTDFGAEGPYLAQVKAAFLAEAPTAPILDLFVDAPAFRPRLAGYLLAHYIRDMPLGAVVLGVVDPGVGTERRPIVVHAGDRWFVGPDNGLFTQALRLAGGGSAWRIDWRPQQASASFHGRDIFAPVAGRLARGLPPPGAPLDPDDLVGINDPNDLDTVIYVDAFGNLITGRQAHTVPAGAIIRTNGQVVPQARTFSDVPVGTAFWYRNANDLVEIAVNQGRADTLLGAGPETRITVSTS